MINSLAKVKNMGVFGDYKKDNNLGKFCKYNLIFGLNGTGKSTLAKIFRSLQTKQLPGGFREPKFSFELSDGSNINESNLVDLKEKVFVFNQDFINENINWNSMVKSIMLISEEIITEKNKYEQIKEQRKNLKNKLVQYKKDQEIMTKKIDNFLKNEAKHIKDKFRNLGVTSHPYVIYNKTYLVKAIKKNWNQLKDRQFHLEDNYYNYILQNLKIKRKDNIVVPEINLDEKRLDYIRERVLNLLATNIVSKSIDKLKRDPQLNAWVEEGLIIHSKFNSNTCEYCGNPISPERINDLKEHFNKNFKLLKEKVDRAIEWLPQQYFTLDNLPTKLELYEDLQEQYQEKLEKLEMASTEINEIIEQWLKALDRKKENPFEIIDYIMFVDKEIIDNYNMCFEGLKQIIQKHNERNIANEKDKLDLLNLLELYYINNSVHKFNYFDEVNSLEHIKQSIAELEQKVDTLDQELFELAKNLSSEVLAAEKINKMLHVFLGREELKFIFDKDKHGYRIIRVQDNTMAINLSESEKTAIGFIYFVMKLEEHGNRVEDSVLVIDDPVSNLDNNNLNNIGNFLLSKCSCAKQLFLLTHNSMFYEMIREKLLESDYSNVCSYKLINVSEVPRRAELING